mgnify:CR=1 FL=1
MTNWHQHANFICKECGHKVSTSHSFITDFFRPDFCKSCGAGRGGWWREQYTTGSIKVGGGENRVWWKPSTWAKWETAVKDYWTNKPEDKDSK